MRPAPPPAILQELARQTGGTIEECHVLPDGSGAATMSFPLPKDHWLTAGGPEEFNIPPMPYRMGTDDPERIPLQEALIAAGRYAVRCATMNGAEDDFDPDALIQNLVVGMLGYHTPTGLSQDDWANPQGDSALTKAAAAGTSQKNPTPIPAPPVPSVHRSVHYFDREELVNAEQQGRKAEPFAAIITRVLKDENGNPTTNVSLAVFDPELGQQIVRDAPQGENYHAPEAGRWYFTPYQGGPAAPVAEEGTHKNNDADDDKA